MEGKALYDTYICKYIYICVCFSRNKIIDPPSPGGRKAGGKLREILRGYIEYNLRYCRGSFENTLENPV